MNTDQDFWLVEHAERIGDTVEGLAFSMSVSYPSVYDRQRLKGTIERQKDITARFTHYVTAVLPFVIEFRPDMPEAQLRAWANALVSAVKGE